MEPIHGEIVPLPKLILLIRSGHAAMDGGCWRRDGRCRGKVVTVIVEGKTVTVEVMIVND